MKVVLCHGVFDLLHRGHIEHLREAREFGDRLVVSMVADKHVRKPHRMLVYDQEERMALLAAVRYVDEVVLCDAPGPEIVIANLLPDVYVRGPDYMARPMPEDVVLWERRIHIRYTKSSYRRTTEIIESIQRHKELAP